MKTKLRGILCWCMLVAYTTGCKGPRLAWDPTAGTRIEFDYPEPGESGIENETSYPARSTPGSPANGTRSLTAGTPSPIGPPAPNRPYVVPLQWSHDAAADGSVEYWLYWSRVADDWQGRIKLPVADGTRYNYITRDRGAHWWTVTAARPPIAGLGETEWQESDPSNILRVDITGRPATPDRLRTPQDLNP